ncbi:hypothetical protein [Eubacterium sp.]|nr:hypothetical protein [Eubacterium sp.]MDO5433350.1 hypothetical protein [Eubacterium sp.]
MEELLVEILISLCQTGAEIYKFAVSLMAIGTITFSGLVVLAFKEVGKN